jgi:hypothetical protein
MDPLVISLVSAATALVASILGPFVTISVAKRQIIANVVSTNRHKWLQELREAIAELVSLLVAVIVVKLNWQGSWNEGRGAIAGDPARLAKLERLVRVQWQIRLLLNPGEADHQAMYRAIDTALAHAKADSLDVKPIEVEIENITALAQSILKREWVRVKRGE